MKIYEPQRGALPQDFLHYKFLKTYSPKVFPKLFENFFDKFVVCSVSFYVKRSNL
jgi:hypothetical protein